MYLVIGHSEDLCAQRVVEALRERSHDVTLTLDVLVEQGPFSWELGLHESSSKICNSSETIYGERLDGVFVRGQGGPRTAQGWTNEDLTYVQAEGQSALLAWLSSLPCPVVNQPRAELWFRPYRPYVEWRALFWRCGLPVLNVRITNDLQSAWEFSRKCNGMVAYTPLTSATRYQLKEDEWQNAAKLLTAFPLCLCESAGTHYNLAWNVGGRIFWAAEPEFSNSARIGLEGGIQQLSASLKVATFEVQILGGNDGPCCAGISFYPRLERYERVAQDQIVAAIVSLLEARR